MEDSFTQDIEQCLRWADGLIIAIPHRCYRAWSAADLLAYRQCRFVIDAQNTIGDDTAASLHAGGMRIAGVGKGHWRKAGFHISR